MAASGFVQAAISGAALIIIVLILRVLLKNRAPKRAVVLLWDIALVRMLLVFTVPSPVSVYSLFGGETAGVLPVTETRPPVIADYGETAQSTTPPIIAQANPAEGITPDEAAVEAPSAARAVWFIGAAGVLAYFACGYIRFRRRIRCSVPLTGDIPEYVNGQGIRRRIRVESCRGISSPLTYGLIRPVILLPPEMSAAGEPSVRLVLLHELAHIKRLDVLRKALAIAVLSLYWFNPLVWLAAALMNKDIELACDESVIKSSKTDIRREYALTLIGMKEKQNHAAVIQSNFSKNAVEERIVAIMKAKSIKRISVFAAAAAVVILAGASAFSLASVDDKPLDEQPALTDENEAAAEAESADPAEETAVPESSGISATTEFTEEPIAQETEEQNPPAEDYEIQQFFPPVSGSNGVIREQMYGFGGYYGHRGIDIAASLGTPIYAAESGTVVLSQYYHGYGNCVMIQHENGLKTVYAHCSALYVSEGDTVTRGDYIADVGITGQTDYGHLHFEVRINDEPVNPMDYLPQQEYGTE